MKEKEFVPVKNGVSEQFRVMKTKYLNFREEKL